MMISRKLNRNVACFFVKYDIDVSFETLRRSYSFLFCVNPSAQVNNLQTQNFQTCTSYFEAIIKVHRLCKYRVHVFARFWVGYVPQRFQCLCLNRFRKSWPQRFQSLSQRMSPIIVSKALTLSRFRKTWPGQAGLGNQRSPIKNLLLNEGPKQ